MSSPGGASARHGDLGDVRNHQWLLERRQVGVGCLQRLLATSTVERRDVARGPEELTEAFSRPCVSAPRDVRRLQHAESSLERLPPSPGFRAVGGSVMNDVPVVGEARAHPREPLGPLRTIPEDRDGASGYENPRDLVRGGLAVEPVEGVACGHEIDRGARQRDGLSRPDARIGTRDLDAEDVQEARCRIDCDDLRRDRHEMSRELPGPRAEVERDARPQPGQERLDLWRPLRSTRLVVETAVAAAPLRHDGDSGSFHTSASASRPRRRRTLA